MGFNTVVSVIIPVFNVKPYLAEALESVINQTYKNLEIIIVDDGSTDGSRELCKKYALYDRRIRLIHQDNKGLSSARNTGLDILSGQVIAFLDSDDAYCPFYIATMMEAMASEKSDVVMCRYSTHTTTRRMINKSKNAERGSNLRSLYSRTDALQALAIGTIDHLTWNKIYNRKLFDKVRFPEGHVYEDIDTTYKILSLCDKVCVLNDSLYLRRKRYGSITDNCSISNISDWFLAYSHFEAFAIRNYPNVFNKKHIKEIQRSHFNQLIFFYLLCVLDSDYEKKKMRIVLRNQICSSTLDFGKIDARIKTTYRMICYCPWLLRIVYPIYRLMRRYNRLINEQINQYNEEIFHKTKLICEIIKTCWIR